MKSPFRSKPQITQSFGNNPVYYGQFGLKGHEGLDLIPTGTVWDVLCLADGVVVRDVDDPRSGAYGIYLTVWHPKIKKATQYCHLKENYVKDGDQIISGAKIGTMGSTGNSTGAHLHLNVYDVDDNGARLNKDNGYNGGIDPIPFLEAEDTPINGDRTLIDQLRAERDTNWNLYQGSQQKVIELEGVVEQKNKVVDALTRENLDLKDQVQKTTEEKNAALASLQSLKIETEKYKSLHEKAEMDLDICKAQRKDLAKYTSLELIKELISRIRR